MAFSLFVAALAFVLVGLIKFNVYVDAQGIVEPIGKEVVNAKWDGFVTDVRVKDGQWVNKGDVLLVMQDKEIDTLIKRLEATLAAVRLKEQQSKGVGDMAQNKIDQIDIETYTNQLKDTKEQQAALVVRAPIEGQVIAPDLKYMPNKFMKRGDELLRVETNNKLIVRAAVEQREVALAARMPRNERGDIVLHKKPEIRMAGDVQTTIEGGEVQLINAAQHQLPHPAMGVHGGGTVQTDQRDPHGQRAEIPQFEMKVDVPARDTDFVAGQRAWVRLTVGKKPLIWQGYVRFLQLIETKNRSSGWIQF